MTTPVLGLDEITLSQALAEVTANEAITVLERAVALHVLDRDLTAPPGGESAGDLYIVGGTGTGTWASQDNKFALYTSGGYRFFPAVGGMVAYVVDEGVWIQHNGTAWSAMPVAGAAGDSRWTTVNASKYTTPAATTSTITMSDTSDMQLGLPLKITINSVVHYVIVTSITPSTSITVMGMALDTGNAITDLSVGVPEMVKQLNFMISGVFADATDTDLLLNHMNSAYRWAGGTHYVAMLEVWQETVDTGTEAKINLLVGGSKVSTEDTNNGIQLGAAATWVRSAVATMHATQNKVEFGDAITPEVTVAGGTGDATNLVVQATLIAE